MAYFSVWYKSRKIHRLKQDLINEKINAIHINHIGDIDDKLPQLPKSTLRQRYQHCCIDINYRIKRYFTAWINKDAYYYQFFYKLRRDGSFENFLLKSIIGFVLGFLLTYLLFLFLVVQTNYKLTSATILCSLIGCILMLGLAFSRRIRCIVFLILPQFFSKRGRQVLLTYAFILAITGPSKNTLNNMTILNESLACGQEQLKSVVKQILDTIRKPFVAIKDAIKTVVKTVKIVVKQIKEILMKIKRLIVAILHVIKAAFQFLGKILNICNKEFGTPFERCSNVFNNAITDCNAKLGPLFNWLCSIAYLIKSVCYIVKIFDYVCMLIDFVNDSIIGVIVKKIKTFVRHIRTIFYVRIKFSHSFHFETNQTKNYKEVAGDIAAEIEDRTRNLLILFNYFTTFSSFFLCMIVLKTIYYRYRFLTSDRFDNVYILKDFRIIDLQRAKYSKETALPLNHRESQQYVKISSVALAKIEKKRLGKAIIALLMAAIKLSTYMVIDYSLFWVMDMISFYGKFQSKVNLPNAPTVDVNGRNLFADLLRTIINAFKPFGTELEIDTIPCLPKPIPPNYDRYIQIISLLIMCTILTILEPYGLRLRNWLMCYYEPFRSRQRTIWLYNHILKQRVTFLKFTRRQLRRQFKLGRRSQEENMSFLEFLQAKFTFLQICLPIAKDKPKSCLLCGSTFHKNDNNSGENWIECQTPGCPGFFCNLCFNDLKNRCPVCLSPIQYGDLSDISEEKGSPDSDDDDRHESLQHNRFRLKSLKNLNYDEENPLISNDQTNAAASVAAAATTTNSSDYSYQYEEQINNQPKRYNKAVATCSRRDVTTSMSGIRFPK